MKVGDYIRTKDGIIAKITDIIEDFSIDCDEDVFDLDGLSMMEIPWYFKDEYIIKSAEGTPEGLLSLIREGDILKVNEFKDVYTICEVEKFKYPYTNEEYLGIRDVIHKKTKRLCEIPLINLKIVTKEQFESMEYEVK